MDEQERARRIYKVIQEELDRSADAQTPARGRSPQAAPAAERSYIVVKEGGCLACDPGDCWECGYLFTGERVVIRHAVKGERVLSDRALHLLSHGIIRYATRYVVRGQAVVVDLDLDELAAYVDL